VGFFLLALTKAHPLPEENAFLLPDCLYADRGRWRTPCPHDAYPLVGGPASAILSWSTQDDSSSSWAVAGGGLGAVVALSAVIAWFAILFTGKHPQGLWDLAAYYMR